jgi:5-formaminoimidazole-4-carboxamide-1-(beta)-D-ribofuranosyl 5'-monophosphate synthetase
MDVKGIVENYGKKVTIGVFGSHSAEEVGMSAKAAGMETVVVCQKGRDVLYTKHNKHLFDHTIMLDKFSDLAEKEAQEKLLELNTIFIPNRSFSVYVGYDNIEQRFEVPIYGNRFILRAEERTAPKNQYWLLEQGGIRSPRKFNSPQEIDRLCIVKVQQKQNPLERAFFYPTSAQEYEEQSKTLLERGVISEEGLAKSRIEEFVLGPRFNANFHSYALKDKFGNFDFFGFEDRIQTDLMGLLNLPAAEQLKIRMMPKNEEVGHKGITMRESLKPMIYDAAEKFISVVEKEYPPGMIGSFALQGAMPYSDSGRPEFVIFDVSPRIPGCPCVGPTSPEMRRLSLKHNKTIESPLDMSIMEIKYAAENARLKEIIT